MANHRRLSETAFGLKRDETILTFRNPVRSAGERIIYDASFRENPRRRCRRDGKNNFALISDEGALPYAEVKNLRHKFRLVIANMCVYGRKRATKLLELTIDARST